MVNQPATIGPYRVIRQLGEGGMGAVFEAVHSAIERRVAIKVLKAECARDSELVARFFNEARAVNRVEHPCLVQISDYGKATDGTVYLVMEYLRGGMLRSRLDQLRAAQQHLPLDQLLQIVWQLAEALTVTHEKGIVHRDLKPENIMLVPDPAVPGGERPKILDFGIAKLHSASQVMTATAHVFGTPCYMSPEQCRGARGIDGRADVYALGIMMYELLVGTPPFRGDSLESTIGQHLFKEPDALGPLAPQAPAALVALVHRMLIKEPAQRPVMAEVESALRSLIAPQKSSRTSAVTLRMVSPVAGLAADTAGQSSATPYHSLGQYIEKRPRQLGLAVKLAAGSALAGVLLFLCFSLLVRPLPGARRQPVPAPQNTPVAAPRPAPPETQAAAVAPTPPPAPAPVALPLPSPAVASEQKSDTTPSAPAPRPPGSRTPIVTAADKVAIKAPPVRSAPSKPAAKPKPAKKVGIYDID